MSSGPLDNEVKWPISPINSAQDGDVKGDSKDSWKSDPAMWKKPPKDVSKDESKDGIVNIAE